MKNEVLKSVKSLIANSSIIGFDIIEIKTNFNTYNIKMYFNSIQSDKYGKIRKYINNVIKFCNSNNIDVDDYFNSRDNNRDIMEFEQNLQVCNIDIYNND